MTVSAADADQGGAGVAPADEPAVQADLTELFRAHHLELVRLAMIVVGDLPTAEDVVQDAFERLSLRWSGVQRPANGLAYVRASVLNGCRSVHRRAAVARKHAPVLAQRPDVPSAQAPDPGPGVAERSQLEVALLLLPRRQREVLVLRYYLDLDVTEIAATLKIAPSGVRSICSRGLRALAHLVGEECE
jgi:RNA polymerase sigma-70 factor (sigma-E family)